MQWVCIIFAVKTSNKKSEEAQVFHYDSRWKRNVKYDRLRESWIWDIERNELNPDKEYHFFVPKDFSKQKKYDKGIELNKLFEIYSSWVKTKVDSIAIDLDSKSLWKRVEKISHLTKEEIIKEFGIADNTTWEYLKKPSIKFDEKKIIPYEYRPFDNRFIYYDFDFLSRPRAENMLNFVNKLNIWLELWRTQYLMVFCWKNVSDEHYAWQWSFKFPLYLYEDEESLLNWQKYRPNFNAELVAQIENQLWMKCNQKAKLEESNLSQKWTEFTPTDLFDYIYAVLHSPKYRETYKEFLKINFPRVPFDVDRSTFWYLVEKWRDLRLFHLLQHPKLSEKSDISVYSWEWEDIIAFTDYNDNKVYINGDKYFDNVPKEAWEFYIWWYQPAQRRFKDRKWREMSFDDIVHYQKMIISLVETIRLMKLIDIVWFIK